MFEFRARVLQAGPSSFLGLVDGFPQIFTESESLAEAERDVLNALGDYLRSLEQPYAARIEQDDIPRVAVRRLYLSLGD